MFFRILTLLMACVSMAVAQPPSWQAHTAPVHSLTFSPDGKTLASAGFDGAIKLWAWPDAKETKSLPAHPSPAYSVAYSPDGLQLATCSVEPVIKIWTAADGKMAKEIKTR